MITSKTIFSHGVFQLVVELEDIYRDLKIDSVDLYEFAPKNGYDSEPYILIEKDSYSLEPNNDHTGFNLMCRFTDKTDRLLKWVVKVDPETNTGSGTIRMELPCCAEEDEHGLYKFEGYAVDLTQYQLGILNAINLQCDGCEVPRDLINALLKMFAVKAAVQSKSPYMEMIFSKVACEDVSFPRLVKTFSRTKNCNCNG